MIKEYKRTLPIIEVKYSILVYDHPADLVNRFKDVVFVNSPHDFQAGVFEIDGRPYICILNDDGINPGIIAHECKHFVNHVFRFIGQDLDRDNDELECYFLTHIVNKVHSAIDSYTS